MRNSAAALRRATRRSGAAGPLGLMRAWLARRRVRRDLLRLAQTSPHLLSDIGLDAAQVRAEGEKPLWRS